MKKAIIKNNIVINVIEIEPDSNWIPPEETTVVDIVNNIDNVGPGYIWDGVQFSEPPPPPPPPKPVPQTVSRQQMMSALMLSGLITEAEWLSCYQNGTLPAIVSATIDTLPTPEAKLIAKVKWVEFSEARRNDDFVLLLGTYAGFTDKQIDDLFITAAAL